VKKEQNEGNNGESGNKHERSKKYVNINRRKHRYVKETWTEREERHKEGRKQARRRKIRE
jgi:hypothetical protein